MGFIRGLMGFDGIYQNLGPLRQLSCMVNMTTISLGFRILITIAFMGLSTNLELWGRHIVRFNGDLWDWNADFNSWIFIWDFIDLNGISWGSMGWVGISYFFWWVHGVFFTNRSMVFSWKDDEWMSMHTAFERFKQKHLNLVGGWATPMKNMKVNWDYYFQFMEK